MADILGIDVPISVPKFIGVESPIVWFVMLLVFICIIGGVAIYFVHRLRVYDKKLVVFENISGQGYQPVYKDRARLIKLGDGGEEVLYLLKKKVYRTAYGKKMGKNTYWFAIGQDGYWYNVVLGDVDAKMGMLDIEPIDRDMRYMHVAIRKNIQDRYKKKSFMEQYGVYIFSAIVLLIILIGNWFILDKIGEITSSTTQNIEAAERVSSSAAKIVASLDNICTGGGGLT